MGMGIVTVSNTRSHKQLLVYLRPDQLDDLRQLSIRTGVPLTEYVRQGIDKIIAIQDPKSNSPNLPYPAVGKLKRPWELLP